jgi:hypothetical protein
LGYKRGCVGKVRQIIAGRVIIIMGADSRASTNIFEQRISPRVVKFE